MGFFTFPGEQEHRKFNYKPIYYDKEEEERRVRSARCLGRNLLTFLCGVARGLVEKVTIPVSPLQ